MSEFVIGRRSNELPPPSAWIPETNAVRVAVLGKLIEENCECGAKAARCIIQGIMERDPKTDQVNFDALQEEVADILALAYLNIEVLGLDKSEILNRAEKKLAHKRAWIAKLNGED